MDTNLFFRDNATSFFASFFEIPCFFALFFLAITPTPCEFIIRYQEYRQAIYFLYVLTPSPLSYL